MNVNWCTSCKCVLANEEVVNGVCERCGSEVVHKVKSQWMLKITEYADRLINDLDLVNYPDRVKAQQKNWIGRSKGAEVDFTTTTGDTLTIYTTRADTLYGATYMVISPEHPMIEKWADKISNMDEIKKYQEAAARKSDFERTEVAKEKTGVRIDGVNAINPVNNKEIPIFISDYVLVSYGTGAIMAVPAHDTRDWEFAKKFDLPIIEVVKGGNVQEEAYTDCLPRVYSINTVNSDACLFFSYLCSFKVRLTSGSLLILLDFVHIRNLVSPLFNHWVFRRNYHVCSTVKCIGTSCINCKCVACCSCKINLRTLTSANPVLLLCFYSVRIIYKVKVIDKSVCIFCDFKHPL